MSLDESMYDPLPEIFDFAPCTAPKGSKFYVVSDLVPEQKEKLNQMKFDTIRENHTYLKEHPEVRGIIAVLLRKILYSRPRLNVLEYIQKYFERSIYDIKEEVDDYLREKNLIKDEEESATFFTDSSLSFRTSLRSGSFEQIEEENEIENSMLYEEHNETEENVYDMALQIVDEICNRAVDHIDMCKEE